MNLPKTARFAAVALLVLASVAIVSSTASTANAAQGAFTVSNHGHECVKVFFDGQYYGEVHAHSSRTIYAGRCCHSASTIVIREECGHVAAVRRVFGHFRTSICLH